MYTALDMRLDIVRTVLKNEVNEVSVCLDRARDTDTFYTLITVNSSTVRKELAKRMATMGLFVTNSDFIGSFTHQDSLNLVFRYNRESSFLNKEILYAESFSDRKAIALSFLTAMAETQVTGDVGTLLLDDRNVNIGTGGKVYMNYFLDFNTLPAQCTEEDFFYEVAEFVFGILSREYAVRHEGQIEDYPNELRLFYRKMQSKTFRSYNQIMTLVKSLSDHPKAQRRGIFRILDRLQGAGSFLASHTMEVFMVLVILVTLFFLGYQLITRFMVRRNTEENTSFVGLETIGEVRLSDEEI